MSRSIEDIGRDFDRLVVSDFDEWSETSDGRERLDRLCDELGDQPDADSTARLLFEFLERLDEGFMRLAAAHHRDELGLVDVFAGRIVKRVDERQILDARPQGQAAGDDAGGDRRDPAMSRTLKHDSPSASGFTS